MKKFLMNFRKFLGIFLWIFAYIFFIYSFFFLEYWLMGSTFLVLFFIFIHFFFIELKTYWTSYLIWIILVSAIVISTFLWYDDLYKITSLFISHIWFALLLLSIDNEVNNRKILSSWAIFNNWVWIFTIFMALTYSIAFISKYDTFSLTCEDINDNMNIFIDTVSKPLKISAQEVDNLKQFTQWIYNTKFKDFIWIPSIHEDFEEDNYSEFDFNTWSIITWDAIIYDNIYNETNQFSWWILWKIDWIKSQIIDNVLEDKELVDQWICEVMIDKISERYDEPWFRLSVITLLFLLLWPSFRFIFFIIWVLSFIFFWILNMIKVYKFEIKMDEVENIK